MRCNRKKLAEILGCDVKTIDARIRKGMPYVTRPGQKGSRSWVFDTGKVLDWLTGNDFKDKILEVRLRLARLNANMREIDLAIKTGEFVAVDDLTEVFEEVLINAKSRLLAMPGRLAQRLSVESDPAVVKRLVQEELDQVIKMLHLDPKALR